MNPKFKRTVRAAVFCFGLLLAVPLALFYALHTSAAKSDPVADLLRLPAPPPPNPLVHRTGQIRPEDFYSKDHPPKDNASIEELIDYWARQQRDLRSQVYNPEMSDETLDRLLREISRDPAKLPNLLESLPERERAANLVKELYDREGANGIYDRETRHSIKRWLTYHSTFFANDLQRLAEQAGDTENYVNNQEELLQLARFDFDRAEPLIAKLEANGQGKASRVLAAWARYRHAVDSNSTSDAERYRDELKKTVEDKTLPGPMRDLAMDALVTEKEWEGRDDWYISLLGDETLGNIPGYTGLTTLVQISPSQKYTDKMIELLKSESPVVRAAAIRNLLLQMSTAKPEVIRALLPWLDDPKWAQDVDNSRGRLIMLLAQIEMPESVPGLIKTLDEKEKRPNYNAANLPMAVNAVRPMSSSANAANAVANAMQAAANSASMPRAMSNSINAAPAYNEVDAYVYRQQSIGALQKQADQRAVPALRRVMNEVEGYVRASLVDAVIACKGYSVGEEVDAVETAASYSTEALATSPNSNTSIAANGPSDLVYSSALTYKNGPLTPAEQKLLLGVRLMETPLVSDDLAVAVVNRIETLDTTNPRLSEKLRQVVMHWQNNVLNLLFLHDLKHDRANVDAVVRLLAGREAVRQQYTNEVFEMQQTGPPAAVGIAACLTEDPAGYTALLEGENVASRTAMLACARLIRAPLPLEKVDANLRSANKMLAIAAERYLEAEDSPAARSMVLALHPNEAKILGATSAFFVDGEGAESQALWMLYQSVGNNDSLYNGWTNGADGGVYKKTEETLKDEVRKDADLLGVYAYGANYVRLYKDRAMFSWDEDDSRYRERALTRDEVAALKDYIATNHADEFPPFLECGGPYCEASEFLMLSRGGGRRVYISGSRPDFFVGLEKYFAELKQAPSKIKYALSRELPGLELLMADDNLHAETVWKNGPDMRAAVSDRGVRKQVAEEILDAAEELDDSIAPDSAREDDGGSPGLTLREKLEAKREFEGFSWRQILAGVAGEVVDQPPGVTLLPVRDSFAIQPTQEQWKSRSGEVEIRAAADGLYKIFRGKMTKLQSGNYSSPVVTPNGKWVVVNRVDDEGDGSLFRVNLVTNKAFAVDVEGYGQWVPTAWLASLNKVVLVMNTDYEGEGEDYDNSDADDVVAKDPDESEVMLFDPETGTVQPMAGEFRPLTQQSFRPLQKTAKPNEYWAAIPDEEKNSTDIGIFDTRVFGFRSVLHVPKIRFNSMSMWVDEAEKKIYFVYRGHLLSLPLP